ncbi:bacteriohopanetetrol glucosamine biosynthesis glycosyltransferase HpnI [Acidocella sp. KAb 2-4]|uniref:bacteriohopanetetrol glucosamine biosynthesis glycosyltransferase HpnI n=1 Tax=Acidocella sp. KAb 2-4 TaxID=2885158 RepID=UPI001D090825|nr:bacteriohopanetetrol glucosamine biosynthesis glycosyltransferase HpnI [Acidocella sp. KAb 2-4]MCB5943420.1 bacteriohopanetetrol glucosamine biosynthesis glycosyltransferase HpnI [Acidocella sp. KAb 2-4]
MHILAVIAALCALVGVAQLLVGTRLAVRFAHALAPAPASRPPVSVLKPLCGVEPLTELALESFFLLDYPDYQLVFGVQNPADPVLGVLETLRARHPQRDVAVVVDPTQHGSNRKVSNLINMLQAAKHETLVMSDADIHVPVHFLDRVLAALQEPGVGLVTTLYTGLPGTPALASLLGACQINYTFLPGALLARQLGRQDCLGVTMALSKTMLAEIGGLAAVANNLADDQVLGRLVLAHGYKLALAHVIPATTVPEADFPALFRHELRWARTIRALVPLPYAASVLQYSLFWAVLALVFAGGAVWSWLLLALVFTARYLAARDIDTALRLPKSGALWLLLLRDLVSAIIYVTSFIGRHVDWRGQVMHADSGKVAPR